MLIQLCDWFMTS